MITEPACTVHLDQTIKGLSQPDNYFNSQRHTLLSKSGVHYVVLGNRLHPQQDHYKRG